MLLTFKPADGDAQEWEFVPDEMGNVESEMIEKRTAWTWDEFMMNLQKGSTLARRALLWTYLRRAHHTLRFEDVSFSRGEVSLEYDIAELSEIRAQTEKAPEQPSVDKTMVLALIDSQIDEARAKLAGQPEPPVGKARGKSAA